MRDFPKTPWRNFLAANGNGVAQMKILRFKAFVRIPKHCELSMVHALMCNEEIVGEAKIHLISRKKVLHFVKESVNNKC